MIILIILLIEINNFLIIILIEINNLIINIGFICYLISNLILPTLLANYIDPSSLDGERIAALILELGTLFSIVIALLGFRKKANYKK